MCRWGKGNSYVGGRGEHLTNNQGQKRRGIRCSAAMRPEWRMRWKRENGAATSTGAVTNRSEEKYRFNSTTILLQLTTVTLQ